MRHLVFAACLAVANSGCGGSDALEAGSIDAQRDAEVGAPSTTYPARLPIVPQVASSGGSVMRSPRVVPVFFPSDPHQSTFVDFLAKLAASPHWHEEVGEYGVGAMSAAAPIVLTDLVPSSIDDAVIQSMIGAHVDDGSFGDHDVATLGTTVFLLHFPASTKVTSKEAGESCTNFFGYHSETVASDGPVVYAVVAECEPEPEQSYTAVIGHELVEAATDPYPTSQPAYLHVEQTNIAWELALFGGEVADLCSPFKSSYFTPDDVGYRIQRTWSNGAMAAFHDPCVPADVTAPYFASVPHFDEDVPVDFAGKHFASKGIVLRVGETKTVDVDFLSDAPTSGPFELTVIDALPLVPSGSPSVETSLDRTRGVNGEKAHLTLTAARANPNGGTVVVLRSVLGQVTRFWYGGVKIDP